MADFTWNFGNSRAGMNMTSPAAIEAKNIAAAPIVNHNEQSERNAQFAKAAEIEDRTNTRNSAIQAIQNKIGENNIQIAKLENEIESIKIKIKNTKQADYEMTDDTVNENIAIADMLKIGEPGSVRDNTSFWRWREQQNDAKASRAEQRALADAEKDRLKEKAIGDFNNKMSNFLTNPTDFDSTAAQNQYISNLNTLITEGQNLGADTSALIEKRNTLLGHNTVSTESNTDGAATTISSLKSMKDDIDQRLGEIKSYNYSSADKVKEFNKQIDAYNKARAEAIKNGDIKDKDIPLIMRVPLPTPPAAPPKTPEEREKEASEKADTAIVHALTAKQASNLKKSIDDAKLTTKQKNTLADWIKGQTVIKPSTLTKKIQDIINEGK